MLARMRAWMRLVVAVGVLGPTVPALAQPPPAPSPDTDDPALQPPEPPPPPPTPPTPPPPPEPAKDPVHTSASVAGAPPDHEASGTIEPLHPGPSLPRRIGQVALFVPRWTMWAAFAPVRGGLYLFNRFQVGDQAKSIFFNSDGTLGIFPLAFVETGFGLNAGVRLIYRDLFGEGGKLQLRASYGGEFSQIYTAKATTGKLLGDNVEAQLQSAFQIFPKSRFFGIGNEAIVSPAPAVPIDPLTDDTAVDTRYRHDDTLFRLAVSYRLWRSFTVRLATVYRHRDFREKRVGDDNLDIFDAYDRTRLVGYDQDLSNVYPELELLWDSRRAASPYISAATPSRGTRLAAFAGYAKGFDDDPSGYIRYGADLAHHFDLYNGDRVLVMRAAFEGVTGDLDEVPFVDLPRLGGPTLLRGYERDRFRDRIATIATIEYQYPILNVISGYFFVDAGRVYRNFGAIDGDSLEDFHVGIGGGIQFQSAEAFIGRFSVFTSIDGGVFFSLGFDPVFDTRAREVAQ